MSNDIFTRLFENFYLYYIDFFFGQGKICSLQINDSINLHYTTASGHSLQSLNMAGSFKLQPRPGNLRSIHKVNFPIFGKGAKVEVWTKRLSRGLSLQLPKFLHYCVPQFTTCLISLSHPHITYWPGANKTCS